MNISLGIDIGTGKICAVAVNKDEQKPFRFVSLEGENCIGNAVKKCIEKLGIAGTNFLPERVVLSSSVPFEKIEDPPNEFIALLLIGYGQDQLASLSERLPVGCVCSVRGGHKVSGAPMESLDSASILRFTREYSPQATRFAVSGYAGVANREHEYEAKQLIAEVADKPICCGSELTSKFHAINRAHTAVFSASAGALFARLLEVCIPAVREILPESQIFVMDNHGNRAPPAYCFASPLAFIHGFLAARLRFAKTVIRKDDAVILVMTERRTVAGFITGGRMKETEKCSVSDDTELSQAGLCTRNVPFGYANTVCVHQDSAYVIGKPALPLKRALHIYPGLRTRLERMSEAGGRAVLLGSGIFIKNNSDGSCSEVTKRQLELLREMGGAFFTVEDLAGKTGKSARYIDSELTVLQKKGLVDRICLTLFDVLGTKKNSKRNGDIMYRLYNRLFPLARIRESVVSAAADGITAQLQGTVSEKTVLIGTDPLISPIEKEVSARLSLPYKSVKNCVYEGAFGAVF